MAQKFEHYYQNHFDIICSKYISMTAHKKDTKYSDKEYLLRSINTDWSTVRKTNNSVILLYCYKAFILRAVKAKKNYLFEKKRHVEKWKKKISIFTSYF